MSVYWYDISIVDKLRSVLGDDRIAIVPTDTIFRYVASLKNDEVKFPLVALSRLGYELLQTQRTPGSAWGLPISNVYDNDGKSMDELQFIPVTISYQLDIITRKRNDNDDLTDELIFYLVNHPTLDVNIGKSANVKHKFSLVMDGDVVDNSDIESHISRGEYFRSTITLHTSDAKLWKSTRKKVRAIDPVVLQGTTDMNDDSKIYFEDEIKINKENK